MTKRKGKIIISKGRYDDNSDLTITPLPHIDGYFVDYETFQAGGGGPCRDEAEVHEAAGRIILQHQNHTFEIIDKREQTCPECHGDPENRECARCGEADCPEGDPMHYHHDGCPTCIGNEIASLAEEEAAQ